MCLHRSQLPSWPHAMEQGNGRARGRERRLLVWQCQVCVMTRADKFVGCHPKSGINSLQLLEEENEAIFFGGGKMVKDYKANRHQWAAEWSTCRRCPTTPQITSAKQFGPNQKQNSESKVPQYLFALPALIFTNICSLAFLLFTHFTRPELEQKN